MAKYLSFSLLILGSVLFGGLFSLQAATPQSLPRIEKEELEYLGAFRLPREDDFSFSGYPLAYNRVSNSLFVGMRNNGIGEVTIPNTLKSENIEALPFASLIKKSGDPTSGGLSVLPEGGTRGLLVVGDKLLGAASVFYDANNTARVSHFSRSIDLNKKELASLKALWQAEKSGFVGGWLTTVPSEWQSLLGGDVLSGNCCMPIVSRTSHGPSAFVWNSSDSEKSLIPATPLIYYPGDHPTLGNWSGSNSVYGGTTQIGGMVIPSGTRSLLYFGLNGTGEFCYGTGGINGECFDPLSSDKGQHAYPYNYQVWAYDLNDLLLVKEGRKNPWDIKPYAIWTLELPGPIYLSGIGGLAYDSSRDIIYISQARADKDGYSSRALIHAIRVKSASTTETKPQATQNTQTSVSSVGNTLIRNESSVLVGTITPIQTSESGGFIDAIIRFLINLKNDRR
jgi:hypothetical protein